MNEEEEFYAWLDGELDDDAAARVEARVAADPALSELADQHRAMIAGLRTAFDPLVADAGPAPRFASADVVEISERRAARARPTFGVPQWAAMAATLVLGLFAGSAITPREGGPVTSRDGQLYAAASLKTALDRQLASTQGAANPIRIGLTYRTRAGTTCRSFSGSAGQGIACREGDDWNVQTLLAPRQPQGDYRMAAGDDPRLAELIDEQIDGEPFDASAEASARTRGWR